MQTQNQVLRQDPAAWDEGFTAGERGDLYLRCPYLATSRQAWSWSSGYVEGKAKRDGYEYSTGAG